MVKYENDTLIINLENFSKSQIQESVLELLQINILQQKELVLDWESQRGYYLLMEILKATLKEKEEGSK